MALSEALMTKCVPRMRLMFFNETTIRMNGTRLRSPAHTALPLVNPSRSFTKMTAERVAEGEAIVRETGRPRGELGADGASAVQR